jgi:hypothetical protein
VSAIPPITGASKPKPEQVEALVGILVDREQICMDFLAALSVGIPEDALVDILRSAARGWEQDRAGHFAIKVDKAPGRPVIVRLQPGEEVISRPRRPKM